MSKKQPFVVGVDPSLAATGITRDRRTSLTIRSKFATGDDRLRLLYAVVKSECFGADFVVLEDLPMHAMSAGLTGMAQGAVRMALRDLGVPYTAIPPSTLKKAATGSGKASKPDMAKALKDFHAAGEVELNLKDDNQVDSLYLREAGLTLLGHHSLLVMPEAVNKYVDVPPTREARERLGIEVI